MDSRVIRRSISKEISLLEAFKKMDEEKVKLLFVFSDKRFSGLLTAGDIQRAIIKGVPLTDTVDNIIDTNKIYATVNDSREMIIKNMRRLRSECMPILDESGELVDVYFWKDLFADTDLIPCQSLG